MSLGRLIHKSKEDSHRYRWEPNGDAKFFSILYHIPQLVHIMYYLLAKEEMQMAFGGVDLEDCRPKNRFGEGIAIVVVIILLLIAMGIVF